MTIGHQHATSRNYLFVPNRALPLQLVRLLFNAASASKAISNMT